MQISANPSPLGNARLKDSLLQRFKADDWRAGMHHQLPQGVDGRQAAEECLSLVEEFPEQVCALLQAHSDVAEEVVNLLPALRNEPQIARLLAQGLFDAGRAFEHREHFPDSIKDFFAQRQATPSSRNQLGLPLENRRPVVEVDGFVPHERKSAFFHALRQSDFNRMETAFEQAIQDNHTADIFHQLTVMQMSGQLNRDSLSDVLLIAHKKLDRFDNAPLLKMQSHIAKRLPNILADAMARVLFWMRAERPLGTAQHLDTAHALHLLRMMMEDHPSRLTEILTKALTKGCLTDHATIYREVIRQAKSHPKLMACLLAKGFSLAHDVKQLEPLLTHLCRRLTLKLDPIQSSKLMKNISPHVHRKALGLFSSILAGTTQLNLYQRPILLQALTHHEGPPSVSNSSLRFAIENNDGFSVSAYLSAIQDTQANPSTKLYGQEAKRVRDYMCDAIHAGPMKTKAYRRIESSPIGINYRHILSMLSDHQRLKAPSNLMHHIHEASRAIYRGVDSNGGLDETALDIDAAADTV